MGSIIGRGAGMAVRVASVRVRDGWWRSPRRNQVRVGSRFSSVLRLDGKCLKRAPFLKL
jgi:hypothetical protein